MIDVPRFPVIDSEWTCPLGKRRRSTAAELGRTARAASGVLSFEREYRKALKGCQVRVKSRERAVGLLPSVGLLEIGARGCGPCGGRVCRWHRLGHGDLHRD